MKKILFTLLLLLGGMTAAWAETSDGSQPEKTPIDVSDFETLKVTIQNDNAAKIRLTANIIVTGLPDTICSDFKGEIDGQGYTISNAFWMLFDSMTDATIKNITFKDFIVASKSDDYRALGGVAKIAIGCTFHDIIIENFYVESHIDNIKNVKSEVSDFKTGGFVGSLHTCKGDVENVIVKNSTIISYDCNVGGITGRATDTHFVRCEVDDQTGVFGDGLVVYPESSAELDNWECKGRVGGLVGYSSNCVYLGCINSALVAGDLERIGGIVGFSQCDLWDCVNTGIVMGLDDDDFLKFLPKYRKKEFHKCEHNYNGKTYILQSLEDDDADEATSEDYVGGIVGYQDGSGIHQCTNYGAVYSGSKWSGGIAGGSWAASIYNCLSAGPVYKGGSILGWHEWGIIKNCCAVADDRPLCGEDDFYVYYQDPGKYHQNDFTLKDFNRNQLDVERTVNSKEMHSGLVARYLNEFNTTGVSPWRQNLTAHDGMAVDLYPSLDPSHDEISFETMASRTAITNVKELIAFAKQVNEGEKNQFACAHLEADIDMSEVENWTPIGSKDSYSQYRGCFDGRGHTIRNLKVSGSAAAGLFGVAHVGAEIRNLIIGKGSTITSSGDEGAGGIIGRVNINWDWGYVRIENCGSYADINVNRHGGGIFGRVWTDFDTNFKLYVNNCFSMGTITAEQGNSGLLCGYTKDNGVVSNCWSGGQLRNGKNKGIWPYSIENPKNPKEAECLVGYNTELNIKDCYIVNPDDNVDKYKEDKGQYPLQAGVEIISDETIATGELTYMLNGNTNDVTKSLGWQQELGKGAHPVFGNKGLYHTREIAKDKYGTICLPYPIKSDEHITYYTFVSDEIEDGALKLNFEYADTVPAAVPVLFLAKDDQTYCFPGAGDDLINENANCTTYSQTPGSKWLFVGYLSQEVVIDDAETAKSFYYLWNNTICNAKKLTVSPYRAFFHGPSIDELRESLGNPSAARISIVIDGMEDETTALELIADDLVPVQQNAKTYTLFGTEAGEGYRGIVIRGGKKVMLNR